MVRFRHFLLITYALALSACSTTASSDRAHSDLNMVSADKLPPPSEADLQASARPYRVGPFDKLVIDVFGIQELSQREVQVDASGRITFPLIGTIAVAGKTPGEVGQTMQDLFRGRYIHDPQVTVNLAEIVSQTVTIGGEVKKPGVYPIVGEMTLMSAIASAEGWTEFAKKSEVMVFRTVDQTEYAAVYNVKAIEKGIYGDPEIYANDVVMVGDSQTRRMWKDFLTTSPLLAPVIYILGRN